MPDMTLAEALALADQDCPLPQLAGQALKVLRAHAEQTHLVIYGLLVGGALKIRSESMRFGPQWCLGVNYGEEDTTATLVFKDAAGDMHVLVSETFPTPKDC